MDRREELLARYRAFVPDPTIPSFIGFQVPEATETLPVVLQDLPGPKDLLALSPATRFKYFNNYNDAMLFSQFRLPVAVDGSMRRALEPKSPFPNPSSEEKERLVEALGTGDCGLVRRLVWRNPRVLITSDDAPQCFKGTWRQTALHMAVQAENYELFCTIMEIIECPVLLQATQMTPFENLVERGNALVRSFLNNRNKKQEAVLDCAVAYGSVAMVDFLTLHPLCDLTVAGRSEVENRALAGSKRNSAQVEEIMRMLNGRWYVPSFGQSEVFVRGTVGDPISADKMCVALQEGLVHGFFGPATRERCEEFRDKIKDKCEKRRKSVDAAGDKAMNSTVPQQRLEYQTTEAECRQLAEEMGGPWKEYWGFLECFVNIRSDAGLAKMEKFLAEKNTHAMKSRCFAPPPPVLHRLEQIEILSLHYTRHSPFPPSSGEDIEEEEEDVFYTPPGSPEPSDTDLSSRYARSRSFLGGTAPNSIDHEVWNVLKGGKIPGDLWYVRGWMEAMQQRDLTADIVETLHKLTF